MAAQVRPGSRSHGSGAAAGTAKSYTPPARWLAGRVTDAKLEDVAVELSKVSGWELGLDKDLAPRRINAAFDRLTPGQFFEALTLLLQARQRVTIALSKADREHQEEVTAAALDERTNEMKLSDNLMNLLDNGLSDTDREALRNGETVMKAFSSLPAQVRALAETYMNAEVAGFRNRGVEFPELDTSRTDSFRIRLNPYDRMVTLEAYTLDGRRVVF